MSCFACWLPGAMNSVGAAMKSKLTQPVDVVERHGGAERPGEKVMINVEETRPGGVAEMLKASDQMTGQTFNDVGRLRDEGTIRVERR